MPDQLILEIRADDQASAALQRVQHNISAAQGSAIQFGLAAGVAMAGAQAAMQAVAAATQALADAVSTVALQIPAQLEQAQVAFTTLLGSAEAARTFLGDLATFVQTTPFELPGLIKASQQLMAYGFAAEEVVPLLTAVGNATAALGMQQEGIDRIVRALGQMQTRTVVASQEMLQLTEAGIPAWQILANAMGVSVGEAMEAVERRLVDARFFLAAFTEYTEQRFGGMMAAQSRTLLGALSNIRDASVQLAQAFEPVFAVIRDRVVAFADLLQSVDFQQFVLRVRTALEGVAAALEALVAQLPEDFGARALEGLGTVAERVAAGLQTFLTVLAELPARLGALLAPLQPVLAGFDHLAGAVVTVAQRLGGVWAASLEAASQALGGYGELVASLASTVGGVLDQLAAGVLLLASVWDEQLGPPALAALAAGWAQVHAALAALQDSLAGIGEALAPVGALILQVLDGLDQLAGAVLEQVAGLGSLVPPILEALATAFTALQETLAQVRPAWDAFWPEAGATLAAFGRVALPVLQQLAHLVGELLRVSLERAIAAWQQFLAVLGTGLGLVGQALGAVAPTIGEALGNVNLQLRTWLESLAPAADAAEETAVAMGPRFSAGLQQARATLEAALAGQVVTPLSARLRELVADFGAQGAAASAGLSTGLERNTARLAAWREQAQATLAGGWEALAPRLGRAGERALDTLEAVLERRAEQMQRRFLEHQAELMEAGLGEELARALTAQWQARQERLLQELGALLATGLPEDVARQLMQQREAGDRAWATQMAELLQAGLTPEAAQALADAWRAGQTARQADLAALLTRGVPLDVARAALDRAAQQERQAWQQLLELEAQGLPTAVAEQVVVARQAAQQELATRLSAALAAGFDPALAEQIARRQASAVQQWTDQLADLLARGVAPALAQALVDAQQAQQAALVDRMQALAAEGVPPALVQQLAQQEQQAQLRFLEQIVELTRLGFDPAFAERVVREREAASQATLEQVLTLMAATDLPEQVARTVVTAREGQQQRLLQRIAELIYVQDVPPGVAEQLAQAEQRSEQQLLGILVPLIQRGLDPQVARALADRVLEAQRQQISQVAELLQEMPGLTPETAQRIVQSREQAQQRTYAQMAELLEAGWSETMAKALVDQEQRAQQQVLQSLTQMLQAGVPAALAQAAALRQALQQRQREIAEAWAQALNVPAAEIQRLLPIPGAVPAAPTRPTGSYPGAGGLGSGASPTGLTPALAAQIQAQWQALIPALQQQVQAAAGLVPAMQTTQTAYTGLAAALGTTASVLPSAAASLGQASQGFADVAQVLPGLTGTVPMLAAGLTTATAGVQQLAPLASQVAPGFLQLGQASAQAGPALDAVALEASALDPALLAVQLAADPLADAWNTDTGAHQALAASVQQLQTVASAVGASYQQVDQANQELAQSTLLAARAAAQSSAAHGVNAGATDLMTRETLLGIDAQRAWAQALRQGAWIVGGIAIPPGVAPGSLYTFEALYAAWLNPQYGSTIGRRMQTGGIVLRPTVALLGEAGPEAVIPLARTPLGPAAAPAPVTVQVAVAYAPLYGAATPAERQAAARQIIRDLREELQRQGVSL